MTGLERVAEDLLQFLRSRHLRLATAESCTGGLIAATLTAVAGSSDVVERGFVTYSNEAKMELLGVPAETIAAHGAVSAQTAAAMARGAIARAPVDLAVSITGVAGPGGGNGGARQRPRGPRLYRHRRGGGAVAGAGCGAARLAGLCGGLSVVPAVRHRQAVSGARDRAAGKAVSASCSTTSRRRFTLWCCC